MAIHTELGRRTARYPDGRPFHGDMHKMRKSTGLVLCGLLLPTLAFAAHKNPVVNVSGLVKPGLYQDTTVTTINGKPGKPVTSTTCLSVAEVHDMFNVSGSLGTVTSYKLHGNHLYAKGKIVVAGKLLYTSTYEITFDNSTHMHGSWKVVGRGKTHQVMLIKSKSHRIGGVAACKHHAHP